MVRIGGNFNACTKACPNGALTVKITESEHTSTNSATWTEALDAIKY